MSEENKSTASNSLPSNFAIKTIQLTEIGSGNIFFIECFGNFFNSYVVERLPGILFLYTNDIKIIEKLSEIIKLSHPCFVGEVDKYF